MAISSRGTRGKSKFNSAASEDSPKTDEERSDLMIVICNRSDGLLNSVSEKGMIRDLETRYKARVARLQCSTDSKEAERIESDVVGQNDSTGSLLDVEYKEE